MPTPVFDLAIVGGGINGCGIASDATGRGLSVLLCEQGDLASGTSSASTKLIHGGLRYLEYCEFRLVRESLREREVLLRAAPHIIWPLRFILPHHRGLRPAWLIRLGLFLYDHLGGRKLLSASSTVDLRRDEAGVPLKPIFTRGFAYSDCWVMDARLVVLNAMDAAAGGAEIRVRTRCLAATRNGGTWTLQLRDKESGRESTVHARALVNATGPWLDSFLTHTSHRDNDEHIRMVKGSHIITRRLFDHAGAYLFQNADGRIIFAIPYEREFTLIGTTEVDFTGQPGRLAISPEETDYLCRAASEYFRHQVTPGEVVSSYAGIRPLFDDNRKKARAVTRDYVLKLDSGGHEAPLLSIYGGKITTYRKLAESVLHKLGPFLPQMGPAWTEGRHLPGGDFSPDRFGDVLDRLRTACPLLKKDHAFRLARSYGTRTLAMVQDIRIPADLGICFGGDLHAFEVTWLMRHEWARTAEDVLWRRTNMGLFLSAGESQRLDVWMREQRGRSPITQGGSR
jgi:glycerol-3-phosphate dehydrogenase